jgi:hypothetical protein
MFHGLSPFIVIPARTCGLRRYSFIVVMAGLVPAIHAFMIAKRGCPAQPQNRRVAARRLGPGVTKKEMR